MGRGARAAIPLPFCHRVWNMSDLGQQLEEVLLNRTSFQGFHQGPDVPHIGTKVLALSTDSLAPMPHALTQRSPDPD
jgi:hypothetical protein